jgi:hypothetical protein
VKLFKKPVVTILGAGPAGLLAAHAAEKAGREVRVFTRAFADGRPQKSELHGCQYLHAHIPGITRKEGAKVSYQIEGTPEAYRAKVYGANWNGSISPDEFGPEEDHYAWDMRAAYDTLWERWYDRIGGIEITPTVAGDMSHARGHTVYCTVPARSLCLMPDEHKFATQDVYAMGTRDDSVPYWSLPYIAPAMTVLCNGNNAPRWYRAATVFGQSTLEWPAGARPPITGVVRVEKPLRTDCDCHVSERWHRLGRYGKWQKGVLVHSAYFEALTLR